MCLGDDHGHVTLGQGRDDEDGGERGEEDMGEGRVQGEQETHREISINLQIIEYLYIYILCIYLFESYFL